MIGKGLDCLHPIFLKVPNYESRPEFLRVRCGHCINCKMFRARMWTLRLAMESKYHKDICFITLTYDPLNVPVNYVFGVVEPDRVDEVLTLCPRDMQLFIKRLRKNIDYPIRYFGVGEYGSRTQRPHMHMIIFGLKPEDQKLIGRKWEKGFVDVKPFFPETCTYIAGYIQKKLYGDMAHPFREPEFLRCSQHIGLQWIKDYKDQFSDEHAYIDYQKWRYPLPRIFRKYLVEQGILTEMNMYQMSLRQQIEYIGLRNDLINKGTTPTEFFNQRVNNARMSMKKQMASRNKRCW